MSDDGPCNVIIIAHVHGKQIPVPTGSGGQRIKWLGHAAIARWDDVNSQGWKRLGIPTIIRAHHKAGDELDMNLTIREALKNGDHVFVSTSLQPHETG